MLSSLLLLAALNLTNVNNLTFIGMLQCSNLIERKAIIDIDRDNSNYIIYYYTVLTNYYHKHCISLDGTIMRKPVAFSNFVYVSLKVQSKYDLEAAFINAIIIAESEHDTNCYYYNEDSGTYDIGIMQYNSPYPPWSKRGKRYKDIELNMTLNCQELRALMDGSNNDYLKTVWEYNGGTPDRLYYYMKHSKVYLTRKLRYCFNILQSYYELKESFQYYSYLLE